MLNIVIVNLLCTKYVFLYSLLLLDLYIFNSELPDDKMPKELYSRMYSHINQLICSSKIGRTTTPWISIEIMKMAIKTSMAFGSTTISHKNYGTAAFEECFHTIW